MVHSNKKRKSAKRVPNLIIYLSSERQLASEDNALKCRLTWKCENENKYIVLHSISFSYVD